MIDNWFAKIQNKYRCCRILSSNGYTKDGNGNYHNEHGRIVTKDALRAMTPERLAGHIGIPFCTRKGNKK